MTDASTPARTAPTAGVAALLAAALPEWAATPREAGSAGGRAWAWSADLTDDPCGQVPAELRLQALGDGAAVPVAFSAVLPARVAPDDHERARALLSAHSAEHVGVGLVDLDAGGAVRYRLTHAPLRPWTPDDLRTLAGDALAYADAALAPAWRSLEADGVRFAGGLR